ncbi:hypothetical protein [Methylobacterium radiotolerans]|uniref:Uncharacterized protein n=2 Tax=Methylobacterium TaxID=407 RepID=B1M022_METRJ|nr:hypothetical protein [Methylobacterium radiotolerans]ACB24505.1 hypothetical protein Mrad2831_2511 [Methylobacterium radiotolerans JCM 2831]GEN01335.1 hypothetical protein MRA01_58740 [Methylobacterium radiotolerans]
MPRRHRWLPDYSHLWDVLPEDALTRAIRARTYGHGRRDFPAVANAAILRIYAGRECLTVADLLAAAAALQGPRGWSPSFAADYVGNVVAWGKELGLLEEASDGERSWRLIERSPVFEIIGGRCVRVRGLPDAEQATMNRKVASLHRRRATLARAAADKVRRRVGSLLDRLAVVRWDAGIPAEWLVFLGDQPAGMQVKEARGFILAAHDDWEPAVTKRWVGEVEATVTAAERDAVVRREAAEAASAAARLAEDADAFEGL